MVILNGIFTFGTLLMFSEALKIILKYQKDTTITIMADPEVEMTRSFFVSHPDAFITGESEK